MDQTSLIRDQICLNGVWEQGGTVFVTNHVGGWKPFAVDLTCPVRPGQEFALRIEVKGYGGQEI